MYRCFGCLIDLSKRSTIIFVLLVSPSFVVAQAEDDAGKQFWEFASETNTVETLELFLSTYPDGSYAAEAQMQLDKLAKDEALRTTEHNIFDIVGQVEFRKPLRVGENGIIGLTIEEVLESSPAFPPFEGLPDALWKTETCSSCHQWTAATLCEQSQNYLTQSPTRYQQKAHPFGGGLKINLRNWAEGGCP